MSNLIPLPIALSIPLPEVEGSVDYREFKERLLRIDQLLLHSGVEKQFIEDCLQGWLEGHKEPSSVSYKAQLNFQVHSRQALRCNIARILQGESFRDFAIRLADSPLLQHFCCPSELGAPIRVPAKSTLQRYSHWGQADQVNTLVHQLLRQAHEEPEHLQLEEAIELESVFMDTTCLGANIHYPVDWVLLRDATRSLMQAVGSIRKHGIVHRMEAPQVFMRRMNQLCIQMTHGDTKKDRKRTLRAMDRLVGNVARHARRYRNLLDEHWQETDWTQLQSQEVLGRLDNILQQLPVARRQARQRILQEKKVENAKKILSLYEPDVRVILRGKAGAPVEFGNTLLIAENPQGLIVDWDLFRETAPADSRLVIACVERIEANLGCEVKQVVADRGFDSAANRNQLEARGIYNNLCPKDPHLLKKRGGSWKFRKGQRRRSQTEARVAIFKNDFMGSTPRSKGFESRKRATGWAVLTHNLWVIARLPQPEALEQAA